MIPDVRAGSERLQGGRPAKTLLRSREREEKGAQIPQEKAAIRGRGAAGVCSGESEALLSRSESFGSERWEVWDPKNVPRSVDLDVFV